MHPKTAQHLRGIAIPLLLAAFAGQAALGVRGKAPTFDEPAHLAAGWACLKSGDLRLSFEHPPFLERWAAIPLLGRAPGGPADYPGWSGADRSKFANFFFFYGNNFRAMFLAARLWMILLSLLMGVVIHAWGRELWGPRGALFSLALFAFSPNLLAHAPVVGTDFGLASFGILSLWLWHRMLAHPSWPRVAAAAAASGLVFLTKFSCITLPVIWTAWAVAAMATRGAFPGNPQHDREGERDGGARNILRERRWREIVLRGAVIAVTIPLMVLADYGGDMGALRRAFGVFLTHLREGHHTYLLGEPGYRGWHHYFVVAWLIKTPIPEIVCVMWAMATFGADRQGRNRHLLLTLPFLVILMSASLGRVCIGYRHILIMVPLGILMAGSLVAGPGPSSGSGGGRGLWIKALCRRWGLIFLLAWQAVGSAIVHPNYLTHFNEAVGGPKNGWKYLADSNLDWGQDLSMLGEWMRENRVPRVRLAYFGMTPAAQYGIRYARLPGYNNLPEPVEEFDKANPPDGIYAIFATNLAGEYLEDSDTYAYFRGIEPNAVIGNSVFIYYVTRHGP